MRFRVFPRSTARRVAIVAIVLLYVGLMAFGGCADRLILFPSTAPIAAHASERRVVPWEGGELEVFVARSPGAREREPEAFLLEFIGNAARAEYIARPSAEQFGDRPVEAWVVNYPGYGRSTGPARLASIPPSSLAAFDALREHARDRPILVSGRSLGSTAALHVSANRDVAGVILHNPIPLRRMILQRFGWWNLWLIAGPIAMGVPTDLDAIGNARETTAPAVFILHGADEVVPPRYQRMVVAAFAGEARQIQQPGARHNEMLTADGLRELRSSVEWLLDVADPPASAAGSP